MFSTDDEKFQALVDRDPQAEGVFVYCVVSTSIVCRPTCYAKLALRKNIVFYDDVDQAVENSFTPCKRCKPTVKNGWNNQRDLVKRSCQMIHSSARRGEKLAIDSIIEKLDISKWYFYRTFKIYCMMTPRKYYISCLRSQQNADSALKLPLIQTKRNLQKQRRLLDATLLENEKFLRQVEFDDEMLPI